MTASRAVPVAEDVADALEEVDDLVGERLEEVPVRHQGAFRRRSSIAFARSSRAALRRRGPSGATWTRNASGSGVVRAARPGSAKAV